MIALPTGPATLYRRVELDARIEGSNGLDLTRLCLEEAILDLDRALAATRPGQAIPRRQSLARAQSAILVLSSGVAPDNPLREALLHIYGSAAAAMQAAMTSFTPATIERVRADLADILTLARGGRPDNPLAPPTVARAGSKAA